jgi:hypothetical protein
MEAGVAPAVVARPPRLELVVQRPAVAAAGLAAEVVCVREDAQEAHQAVQLACRVLGLAIQGCIAAMLVVTAVQMDANKSTYCDQQEHLLISKRDGS